ncbi:MAG: deoxyribonuclease IV [Acidobacteriota bacterium]
MSRKRSTKSEIPLLGAHMSIAGGTPQAIMRALQVGCNVLQIFVKNSHRWQGRTISESEATEFHRRSKESGLRSVVAHDSYLINLSAPGAELWERSIEALVDEISRSQRLGLRYLVAHPGAHVGEGESWGVRRVSRALDRVHSQVPDCRVQIALETTAGQGTSLGYRFEHLRDILGACRDPGRVAVCLDTCHVFAAGYDLRDEESYQRLTERFDQTIGLDKLKIFHVNDSKRELGSRVDRHEHIGQGKIGTSGFARILQDDRFSAIPKILETPKGRDLKEDRRNLRVLRRLARKAKPARPHPKTLKQF